MFFVKFALFLTAMFFGLTSNPNDKHSITKVGGLLLLSTLIPDKINIKGKLQKEGNSDKMVPSEEIKTFNLNPDEKKDPMYNLIANSNKHPHIMVVGKTGSGKTTFTQLISCHCLGKKYVIAPHFDPAHINTEWCATDGIFGTGRNYGAPSQETPDYDDIINGKISTVSAYQALSAILTEMNRRYRSTEGFDNHEVHNWFIDEAPAIAKNLPKVFAELLAPLIYEARKVNIRIWLLTQNMQVETLGIKGQGKIRDNFTLIHLADAAQERYKELYKTPYVGSNYWEWCLINDEIASRPSYSSVMDTISKNTKENRFISKFPPTND